MDNVLVMSCFFVCIFFTVQINKCTDLKMNTNGAQIKKKRAPIKIHRNVSKIKIIIQN